MCSAGASAQAGNANARPTEADALRCAALRCAPQVVLITNVASACGYTRPGYSARGHARRRACNGERALTQASCAGARRAARQVRRAGARDSGVSVQSIWATSTSEPFLRPSATRASDAPAHFLPSCHAGVGLERVHLQLRGGQGRQIHDDGQGANLADPTTLTTSSAFVR